MGDSRGPAVVFKHPDSANSEFEFLAGGATLLEVSGCLFCK